MVESQTFSAEWSTLMVESQILSAESSTLMVESQKVGDESSTLTIEIQTLGDESSTLAIESQTLIVECEQVLSGSCFLGGFSAGGFEAFTKLVGNSFQSRGLFGGCFDVVVDGEAAAHGFTADGHQSIVYLFIQLLQTGANVVEDGGEFVVHFEFADVKAGGQDVGIGLGGGEAIADEGEAFVAHLVELAAFVDAEMDEEGHFGFDRGQCRFDVLKIFGGELGGNILVRHRVKAPAFC
jgi:hypothetical protein